MLVGAFVLLRGDNEPSVAWIWRSRGSKKPPSGALVRVLDALEESTGRHFQSSRVSGVLLSHADGICQWDASGVRANLIAACPHVRWRHVDIREDGQKTCSAVLTSTSCGVQLRQRLSALTWCILNNFVKYRTDLVKRRVLSVLNPDQHVHVWQLVDYDEANAFSVLGI